jgi:peptidoglycan hydrolase CwlO-like protein
MTSIENPIECSQKFPVQVQEKIDLEESEYEESEYEESEFEESEFEDSFTDIINELKQEYTSYLYQIKTLSEEIAQLKKLFEKHFPS